MPLPTYEMLETHRSLAYRSGMTNIAMAASFARGRSRKSKREAVPPARARNREATPTTWEAAPANRLNFSFQKGQMASPQGVGRGIQVPSIVFSSSSRTTLPSAAAGRELRSNSGKDFLTSARNIPKHLSCVPFSSSSIRVSGYAHLHIFLLGS